jgi:hypothetical protein
MQGVVCSKWPIPLQEALPLNPGQFSERGLFFTSEKYCAFFQGSVIVDKRVF